MADYIVGDIQGCFSGLKRLLRSVCFTPGKDKLIAVGDLVGRGPESLATLNYLYSLGENFDTVLGNHDLHLLAISCGIRQAKPKDKLDELLNSPQLKTLVDWLRSKPLALPLNDNILVTHAGLYPQWSFAQALNLSQECSAQLHGPNWQVFLSKMYGNQPDSWDDNLVDEARWRFIINAFTRMRYMLDERTLEFKHNGSEQETPKSLKPWFKIPNNKLSPKEVLVFGHWATLEGQTNDERKVALDTGYIWQKDMTLWEVDSGKKYSVRYQD